MWVNGMTAVEEFPRDQEFLLGERRVVMNGRL